MESTVLHIATTLANPTPTPSLEHTLPPPPPPLGAYLTVLAPGQHQGVVVKTPVQRVLTSPPPVQGPSGPLQGGGERGVKVVVRFEQQHWVDLPAQGVLECQVWECGGGWCVDDVVYTPPHCIPTRCGCAPLHPTKLCDIMWVLYVSRGAPLPLPRTWMTPLVHTSCVT